VPSDGWDAVIRGKTVCWNGKKVPRPARLSSIPTRKRHFLAKNAFPPEKRRIPERNRTLSPPEKAWCSLGNTFLSVAEAFSRMESRLPKFKTTFLASEK